jgi:hypothetical protein
VSWPEPPPEDPPRDSAECHHTEGGRILPDETVIRCVKCGGIVGEVPPPSKLCSCQRAGAYATECLLIGRWEEGREG